jgi:transcriptional regulator with XRE-family HTH domain
VSARTTHRLDVRALHLAIYARAHREGLNAKQVAEQTGVCESTLTRIKAGKAPDADGLVTLLVWLGRGIEDFTELNAGARP